MSKSKKEKDSYSVTEVGTLIESFRSDISIMAEQLNTVCEDISILKQDVGEIKNRLMTVEDVIRISLPDVYRRLNRLETKVFGTN